jgi:hypothetical protein
MEQKSVNDLSIVLFGLPAAGKSSLLGALAQAAQAQEHLLNGKLTDVSHGLDELRRRLYEESARRTADEVVPYAVDFEPFHPDERKAKSDGHVGAVLIDCDGRVANDLLVRRQAIADDSPEGTLAREVLDADTLVLVLDASAPPAQVESDFAEFDRFLRQLETRRGERAEVGGLPVFLVLTKCDLLAGVGDTTADWMERIEQHKRDVDGRFRRFLARREQESGPLPFGRLELHLWATAVKRPALAGSPAKEREPYGVAELFRQCLECAAAFRGTRRRAGRRLLWTAGGAIGLVAAMIALAAIFTLRGLDTPTNVLRERFALLRDTGAASEMDRLRAPLGELRERLKQWRELRDDPQFDELSAEQRQTTTARIDELETYLGYYDRVSQSPRPRDARSRRDLEELERNLKTELSLPRPEWKNTEAGRVYAQRLQDASALAAAVDRAEGWYRESTTKAETLRSFAGQQAAGVNWARWTEDAESLLSPEHRPPFSATASIAGAASTLTYEATVLRYAETAAARADWETKKVRLQRILDVATALGLAKPADKRAAPLDIPRKFTLAQARSLRNDLELVYKTYKSDFVFDTIPDAIRPAVDQAARTSYEHLLEPARAAVLQQLQRAGSGTEETRARWQSVRDWLRDPKELEDWRVLAFVLIRLQDPAGPHTSPSADPVAVLAEFLDRPSFSITVRRLTLEVSESLERKPTPEGALSIYHPASAGEKKPALLFKPSGEGERDARRRVWMYTYRLDQDAALTYRPGDTLWAVLPLQDERTLTWVRCRSLMYQFERLSRPPRLHKNNEAASDGKLEQDVRLLLFPTDGIPRVPDLIPVVRLTP